MKNSKSGYSHAVKTGKSAYGQAVKTGKVEKHIALNKREFLDVELGLNIKKQNTHYVTMGKNVSSYFHLVLLLLPILYYSILKNRKKGG